MSYTSVEQRIVAGYLATFPDYFPKKDAPVSIEAQREFYDRMKGLLERLNADPSLLVPSLHEDDCFPGHYKNVKGSGKQELDASMRKIQIAVKNLLNALYALARGEEVELNRRQQKILALTGFEGELPEAARWMATRADANPTAFAFCLFDEHHVYAADVYARLVGKDPYRRLVAWMLGHGYRAFDQYNREWPDYRLLLSYANPAWSGERPTLGNEYKVKHTGLSAQYDSYAREPVLLGLCIPGGMKPFLEHYTDMPAGVRDFVLARTKKCDGCRYCVQTDKTGKRPLANIVVTHQGATHRCCPLYPGWSYSWTSLSDDTVDSLIDMLAFMDSFAPSAE